MQLDPVFLTACQQHDNRALHQLYRLCYSEMLAICMRYARDREEAVHYLSLAFTHVVLALHQYDLQRPFAQWMHRLTVNRVLDEIRRQKRLSSKEHLPDDLDAELAEVGLEDPSRLDYAHLLALIRQLPAVSGTVFNLYVIDGFAHREIAEQLQISENTSRWHLAYARKLLQAWIRQAERITT